MKITTKEEAKAKLEEAIQIQRQMQEFLDKDDSNEELFKQRDEWFLGVLKDLKVGMIEPTFIQYLNSKNKWMIQDFKNGVFYLSRVRIWSVLRDRYHMEFHEFQQYVKNQLLTHLNWRVETVIFNEFTFLS